MIENITKTKLACTFVDNVLRYITRVKYTVAPCLEDLTLYFSKYKLSTSLEDCLTYEDICELNSFAAQLPEIVPVDPVVTNCNELADITLTKSSRLCQYSVGLVNPQGLPSAFPVLNVIPDTIYQQGFLQVKAKGCNEEELTSVSTGCINVNDNVPPSCNLIYNQEVIMNFGINIDGKYDTTGYVKELRIYETDTNGVVLPTPIDVNIAPSNLIAWTSCPLCSGVSAGDLFFGSANWATAMKVLLDNVTYTLHGALNSSWSTSKIDSLGLFRISQHIKHQPSDQWLGIDKNDFLLKWVNYAGVTLKVTNPSMTLSQTINAISDDFTLNMDCGNVTGRVVMTTGDAQMDHNQSNWINYVPSNTTFNKSASIVNLVSPSCTKTTLTASYTLNGTFVDVIPAWYDPYDNFISDELSITVITPGVYTFILILDEGCSSTSTITVT